MSLDDLERLTDQLGGRDVTPFVKPLDDRPYVIRVIKEPDDELNFANAWHTDLSYLPMPPSFTLLHAREVPDHGGDTVWANQYLAFETLSAGLRDTLLQLRCRALGRAWRTGPAVTSTRCKGKSSMAIEPSKEAYRHQVHPCGHAPSRDRPRSAVRELRLHDPHRRDGRTARAPGCSVTCTATRSTRTSRADSSWRPRHAGDLGQPVHAAQRARTTIAGVRREMFRTSVAGASPIAARETVDA